MQAVHDKLEVRVARVPLLEARLRARAAIYRKNRRRTHLHASDEGCVPAVRPEVVSERACVT